MGCPITKEELLETMCDSVRDKSPKLDGWGVEIFIHLFDLMIPDLLADAEESRINGFIPGAINATFISLIQKKENPQYFANFRPISLCNTVYKLISKLIA